MANALKFSTAIALARLASAPSSPENGYMYYDTSLNKVRLYENGGFVDASGISSPDFKTDVFRISDATDDTKKLAFDVSAVTGGTTRTITMPDQEVDLGQVLQDIQDIQDGQVDLYLPISGAQAASTEDIASLQDAPFTADGYEVQSGDLILVKDQNDPTENGVYIVQAGPWERIFRLKDGDMITVQNGNKNKRRTFKCYTDFPRPDFGTSNIFFDVVAENPDSVFGESGFHVYVQETNVTLSGEQTLDGFALTDGNNVFLNGQTDPTENGMWRVRVGAWERNQDIHQGSIIQAFEGVKWRNTSFRVFSNGDRVINFGVDEIGAAKLSLDFDKALGSPSARSFANTDVTLSGEQTISGVSLVDGNQVLLGGQTDETENGLWTVRSGAWERETNYHVGSFVRIGDGDFNGNTYIIFSSGDRLINFGVDDIFVNWVADRPQSVDNRLSDLETKTDDLVTLSGVPANSTDLGTFTGAIIPDNSDIKGALQSLETSIENLPNPITYEGTWDASTNTPTLADGTGDVGDLYQVSVAGTQDLGSGNITFAVNDKVVYNGATWEKWDQTDAVTSVNGQTGAVVLALDDIDDVDAAAPNDGDVLTYDTGTNTWVPAAPTSGSVFADNVFRIQDDGDPTKQIAFQASGIATATTRTITMPNADISLATDTSGSFANRTLSNLGTVAVNADFMPGSADTRQMGSSTLRWANVYLFANHYYNATSTEVGSVDGAGSLRIQGLNGNQININTNAGSGANINIFTGAANGTTGNLNRSTGNSALSGNSGDINDTTGTVVSGTRGSHNSNAQSFRRMKAAGNFVEEEYIHSVSLSSSQTNTVITELTFAHATVEALEITYKVKEATSNDIKVGTFRVVTNGTDIAYNEQFVETNDTGITFDAVINGANVNIRYSSGSNGATLRADVKKILA